MSETIVVSVYDGEKDITDFAFERGESVVSYTPLNDRVGEKPWTIIGRGCREIITWHEEHDSAPTPPDHREYVLLCMETGELRIVTEGDLLDCWKRLAEGETDARFDWPPDSRQDTTGGER